MEQLRCISVFEETYRREPENVAFCPYRISPLGAHIDHQFGKSNGLAIDKGIHFAYRMKHSGICEVYSVNFPGSRVQFHVSSVPPVKQNDWADHLRGAALMLGEKYKLQHGVAGVLEGSLPIGGLFSSAAVIIVFLSALCKVNDIHLGGLGTDYDGQGSREPLCWCFVRQAGSELRGTVSEESAIVSGHQERFLPAHSHAGQYAGL